MNINRRSLSLSYQLIIFENAATDLTTVKPLPMRCILSLSLFSLVSIARCLTLAPDVLTTNQISSSNNPGSSSHEYDFPDQGLSEIADASNDGCPPDGAATGKAAERRNLITRGKVCRPSDQEKRPAGAPLNPPPSRLPSRINPNFPGHLDNLPESYPLLHLKPNELNLDEEICPPNMAGDRRYAYCDTGLTLDRIIHDTLEPRSWDLLRCEDCTSSVIDILSLSPLTNFFSFFFFFFLFFFGQLTWLSESQLTLSRAASSAPGDFSHLYGAAMNRQQRITIFLVKYVSRSLSLAPLNEPKSFYINQSQC